jgi:hypothetical protein
MRNESKGYMNQLNTIEKRVSVLENRSVKTA